MLDSTEQLEQGILVYVRQILGKGILVYARQVLGQEHSDNIRMFRQLKIIQQI